jgi:nucleotide-binding universal stress UspA family protein
MPDMGGVVLPAMSPDEVAAVQRQAFDTALAPVRPLLRKARVAADEVCLAGNAGDEIAALAKKRRLDVLVLGSHGYGALKAAVLGSVATRVAARCATPMLIVR